MGTSGLGDFIVGQEFFSILLCFVLPSFFLSLNECTNVFVLTFFFLKWPASLRMKTYFRLSLVAFLYPITFQVERSGDRKYVCIRGRVFPLVPQKLNGRPLLEKDLLCVYSSEAKIGV